MANQSCNLSLALGFLLLAMSHLLVAHAGDPDILTDYIVPPSIDPKTITRQFFTFTGFRNIHRANLTGAATAVITKATAKEFPALVGQGVSAASIVFPPGGINPLHTHPRAAELLMVVRGTLEVGFVDSNNKLFVQTLQAPDLFVFPKGLVHFQVNVGIYPATAIGMFGSENAGTVPLGKAIFGSGIGEDVLAKSFKADVGTVDKIVKGF